LGKRDSQAAAQYGHEDIIRTPSAQTHDKEKLKALKPASHKALVTKGLMGKIYAHIHSLENFARLYSRAVARARAPANPKRR